MVWIEYCNMIFENSKRYCGAPLRSSAVLGKCEILTRLDILKIHSQRLFALHFIEWTKWSSYQLINVRRSWLFSKGEPIFDFIKYVIRELTYKVKSWTHNWERLTTCQSFLTSVTQQLCSSGFPIRVRLVGGHFGQNWQKLDENYKINIFWTKQWEDIEGTSQFFG